MTERLRAAIDRGVVLLDAAMGTRLIATGLRLVDDDPSFWNLDRPDVVLDVHRRDIAAGAEALVTNTFGANRVWLARFGRAEKAPLLNRLAVALARKAAGARRVVIGSIGPTAADDPGAYLEQVEALAGVGVDAVVFETHRLDQAETALRAVGTSLEVPRLVSLVEWPADVGEAVRRLSGLGAWAVGGNCQIGMEPALRLARSLREVTDLPLYIKPSAGLPGQPQFAPESFAAAAAALRELRPILVGGCCGTTEAHVAALGAAWYDVHEATPVEHGRDRGEVELS